MADLIDAPTAPFHGGLPAPPGASRGPSGPPSPAAAAMRVAPPLTGPVLSADPSCNPIPGAGPELPGGPGPDVRVHERGPRQNGSPPAPGAFPIDAEALLGRAPLKEPARTSISWRRIVKTVVWLCVLAGLAGAGYRYGPDLYERYTSDDPEGAATAHVGTVSEGMPAPLSFPATTVAVPAASATIELSVTTERGPIDYVVTTDFASAAATTSVDRPGGPSLQVLTVGDDALIRRADDDTWYRTARGGFPFDGERARADWVRTIDELFPADIRASATILGAAEQPVAGVATRHLVVEAPLGLLPSAPSISLLTATPSDAAASRPEVAAAVAEAPDSVVATDSIAPGSPRTSVEIWIDGTGIIRQAVGSEVFGVDRLTVREVSDQAWVPVLPPEESIRPLDADAVVHLGL